VVLGAGIGLYAGAQDCDVADPWTALDVILYTWLGAAIVAGIAAWRSLRSRGMLAAGLGAVFGGGVLYGFFLAPLAFYVVLLSVAAAAC
jgi:hypothetical protein